MLRVSLKNHLVYFEYFNQYYFVSKYTTIKTTSMNKQNFYNATIPLTKLTYKVLNLNKEYNSYNQIIKNYADFIKEKLEINR